MPHRFTADHRDRIPKQKQRVTNWPEYNESLRQRGDLAVWISEDALALWAAPPRTTRGGQPELRPCFRTLGYFTPVHERGTKWDNIDGTIRTSPCTRLLRFSA